MSYETVFDLLHYLQKSLDVPKSRLNKFGGYNYRNCEDILDAVKRLLPEGATISLSDEIKLVGERYYIKATACLKYAGECICSDGWAREAADKKGMDESQITGATSSYARKYALNGLFSIDDVQDADGMDNRDGGKKLPKQEQKPSSDFETPELRQKFVDNTLKSFAEAATKEELADLYELTKARREAMKAHKEDEEALKAIVDAARLNKTRLEAAKILKTESYLNDEVPEFGNV